MLYTFCLFFAIFPRGIVLYMIVRFVAHLFIFLVLVSFCYSGSIPFSLLDVPLDDPMIADVYCFIDRVMLKYQLTGLLKNRRPYTYGEVCNILNRLAQEDYELTLIERQQLKSFTDYFFLLDSLLAKKDKDHQFNLNLESGLISTYRSLPANSSETEYTWQIRPIVTGHIQENFAFLTDLRFFLITGTALDHTIRMEVKSNQDRFYTAGLVPSYGKFRLPWFDVLVGKANLGWGAGRHGNLLISAFALPMDMLQLRATYDNVGFQSFMGLADSSVGQKIISGHRLDFNLWDRLYLGVSEVVVIGKSNFEMRFLNPFTVYTVTEPTGAGLYASENALEKSQGNLLISCDLELLFLRNLSLYGELMIDDFQPEFGLRSLLNWGSKFGIQAGLQFIDFFSVEDADLRIEYTFINQYSYTHLRPINVYTHLNQPIGHRIGPDADKLLIELRYQWTDRMSTTVSYEMERQGEQDINQPHPRSAPVVDKWEFLSGITELRRGFSIAEQYSVFGNVIVKGKYTYWRISNLAHQRGKQDNSQELTVTSLYRF